MKYLQTSFFFLLFGLIFNQLSAQESYLYLRPGYSFGILKGEVKEFYNHSITDNNVILDSRKSFSMGKGINFSGGFQTFFENNLGFDFNINYLKGGKIDFYKEEIITVVKKTTKTEMKSTLFSFTPSLVFHSGTEKFKLNCKIGPTIAFPNISYVNTINIDTLEIIENWKNKIPASIGLSSTIGFQFKVSDKVSLGFNINFVYLVVSPKSANLELVTENDVNKTRSYKPYFKEKVYQEEINLEFNTIPNEQKPHEILKDYYPYSNCNLSLTLYYRLFER